MKRCNLIADSLISGEPLSDGDRAHLATCADCAQLATVPGLIAATATAPEPGPGFVARMSAGARERLASRRRQRVIGFTLATATAAAAAVVITQRADRAPHRPSEVASGLPAASDAAPPDPETDLTDDELRELARGTSLSRAMAPVADWNDIEAPVSSYRAVLARGGTP